MHANSVLAFWGPVSLTNTAAMSVASGSRTGEGTVLPPQEFALCYVGVLPDSLPAIPVLDLAPPLSLPTTCLWVPLLGATGGPEPTFLGHR